MAHLRVLFVQNQACSRTWKQARTLAQAGHAVSLFEVAERTPSKDLEMFDSHVTVGVGRDIRSMVAGRRRILRAAKAHLASHTYDIVHTANAPDALGAWFPRITRTPVVHDVHDIQTATPTRWSDPLRNAVIDRLKARWERAACRRARRVLTTSPGMARHFREKYGTDTFHAVENKPLLAPVTTLPKRSAEDGETHLVYAGGLTTQEGGDRALLPPFRELADRGYHIHVYPGFENAAEEKEIRAYFGAHPRLHLEPRVAQDRFIDEMTRYDAGIIWFRNHHLNIRVASPNKLYEFQVAGIPIVTNVTDGHIAQHVKANDSGYVVPDVAAFDAAFDHDRGFMFDTSHCFLKVEEIEDVYAAALGRPMHTVMST